MITFFSECHDVITSKEHPATGLLVRIFSRLSARKIWLILTALPVAKPNISNWTTFLRDIYSCLRFLGLKT
jgi:hypothetical protein